MEELNITSQDRILVIAPHPDDECIGVGGLLSLFSKQCDIWVLTDGRKGIGKKNEKEVKEIREKEFLREMEFLKPKNFRMFEVKDSELSKNEKILVHEELRDYTIIFVTNSEDIHKDHQAAFQCVKNAILAQKINVSLYQYEISEPLTNVTHYLDISGVIEIKKELIRNHKSQIKEFNYFDMVLSLNRYRSTVFQKNTKYIETYKKTVIFE